MPLYDYTCGTCGASFERRAGYEDKSTSCTCGGVATRASFNVLRFVMEGQNLPDPSDKVAVQQEYFKEVRKAGWTGERAMETLRQNKVEDAQGRPGFDMAQMPRSSA